MKLFINERTYVTDQDFENLLNMSKEFQTINLINSPFIVYVYGIAYSFENEQITLGIVEEFVEMDLSHFLQEKQEVLSLDEKVNIAINITNGLLEIHHKKFVHHDIKPANILITKKGHEFEIKIADFGTCLHADNEIQRLNGLSWNYGAPENILHCCFDFPFENTSKSDIWSLGIVFNKIFLDDLNIIFPWSSYFTVRKRNTHDNKIITSIQKEKVKKNHYIAMNAGNLPWEIIVLLNECLQVNFENRPNIDEILENLIHLKRNLNRFRLKIKRK